MQLWPQREKIAKLKGRRKTLHTLNEAAGIVRATEYYKSQGDAIIETNWSSQNGKVELIAESADTLWFVKVRAVNNLGENDELDITDEQKVQLERIAADYTSQHDLDKKVRVGTMPLR